MDVTGHPEPRFYRALLNARAGNCLKAQSDVDFCLRASPENPSHVALAAFVAACQGDELRAANLIARARGLLSAETPNNGRALGLIGEAEYWKGNVAQAQQDWARAVRVYPHGHALALLAAKKHLSRGEQRIATMLLSECMATSPDSAEAREARSLLAGMPNQSQ